MKFIILISLALTSIVSYSQEKNFIDQPFIETSASVDTLIIPDRIFIAITLNENDSKNKKSTEELEKTLRSTLELLNINIETSLSVVDYASNFKNLFLKGQNILKTKMYLLEVRDAATAIKVLTKLEENDISNVSINRTEYSGSEKLLLELKAKAVKKAKQQADMMTAVLNQKVGRALYINDSDSDSSTLQGRTPGIRIRGASSIYGSQAAEPLLVEFEKLKFEAKVIVKFAIN